MQPDYKIVFFVAKDSAGWFLGKNCKGGYYVSLRLSDLNPFNKKKTTSLFLKELFK